MLQEKKELKLLKKTNQKFSLKVPLRAPPRYNPRRRSGLGCWYSILNHSNHSGSEYISPTSSIGETNLSWNNSHYHALSRLIHITSPSSPCPSDHRQFNSASSSLSESSSSHRSQEDDISFVTGNIHPIHHDYFVFSLKHVLLKVQYKKVCRAGRQLFFFLEPWNFTQQIMTFGKYILYIHNFYGNSFFVILS